MLMNKKWLWLLLGVAIPCLLNMIFYFELIPSSLSSNSWLSFWGGYLGGIATLAAFFLSNKATKLVILRQWEEKKFVEYKNSLLDNLKLFNTVEILNGISNVSFDALDEKIEIITKKKQEIYSCDIAFRTISMVDSGNVNKEEKQYYNCWQCIIANLSQFLDQQLDLISFCKNHKSNVEILRLSREQERNLKEMIKNSMNDQKEKDEKDLKELQREIADLTQKQESFQPQFKIKLEVIEKYRQEQHPICIRNLYELTLKLIQTKEKALKYFVMR